MSAGFLSDSVLITRKHDSLKPFMARVQKYAASSLHEIFELQARKTPDQLAVISEKSSMSYAELDDAANALAHVVRDRGVERGNLVGLHLLHSNELVAAVLGILKAGAACVPLDPEYPDNRIRYLIDDAGIDVIVSQKELQNQLSDVSAEVIWFDRDVNVGTSSEKPLVEITSDDLACVFYTSGSTGYPKGVVQTHRDCINGQMGAEPYFKLGDSDRLLLKAAISTSGLFCDIFWPLARGASIVIVRPGGHRDTAYLVDLIARERITLLHAVPSQLLMLLQEPYLDRCIDLRHVVCAGEPLHLDLRERAIEVLDARVSVIYGSTEVPSASFRWCDTGELLGGVDIGKPLGKKRFYVLDERLQEVPVGVSGELCISGPGVARGYLNQPDLTAEKFLPDPFLRSGERMYRTGDSVKVSSTGTFEYLGRIDHQVKIRGYRVEPTEIEALLLRHTDIQQAVVVAQKLDGGPNKITAYIVTSNSLVSTADIRRYLALELPDYMIPASFVFLDSLPVMVNGKIDRRSLQRGTFESSRNAEAFAAPANPTEAFLAQIWMRALGIENIGMDENFFDLGGDSIIAQMIVNRIQEMVDLRISVAVLFECQTIRAFSRALEEYEYRKNKSPFP
jgi:amino acid adenylation domain-containing protein